MGAESRFLVASPRRKPKASRPAAKRPRPARKPAKAPTAKRPPARPAAARKVAAAPTPAAATVTPAGRPTLRRNVLSLSFLRDGDEFLARLETDGGQITELKSRALDQLLTLVASELEDLLE